MMNNFPFIVVNNKVNLKCHQTVLKFPLDAKTNCDDRLSIDIFQRETKRVVTLATCKVDEDNFAQLARRRNKKSINLKLSIEGDFTDDVQLFVLVGIDDNDSKVDKSIIKFIHQCSSSLVDQPTVYILSIHNVTNRTFFEIGLLDNGFSTKKESINTNVEYVAQNKSYEVKQDEFNSINASVPIETSKQCDVHCVKSLTMAFFETDVDVEVNDKTPITVMCSMAYSTAHFNHRQLQSFRRFHRSMEAFIRRTYGQLCGNAYMNRVQQQSCDDCRVAAYDAKERSKVAEQEYLESTPKQSNQRPQTAHASSPKRNGLAKSSSQANTNLKTQTLTPPFVSEYLRNRPYYCVKPECAGSMLEFGEYYNPSYIEALTEGLTGPRAGLGLEESEVRFHMDRWKRRDKKLETKRNRLELRYEEEFYRLWVFDKFVCPDCGREEPFLDARFRKKCIEQDTKIKYVAVCRKCRLPYGPNKNNQFVLKRWEQRMQDMETMRQVKINTIASNTQRMKEFYDKPYQFKDKQRPQSASANSRNGRHTHSKHKLLNGDFSKLDWSKILVLTTPQKKTQQSQDLQEPSLQYSISVIESNDNENESESEDENSCTDSVLRSEPIGETGDHVAYMRRLSSAAAAKSRQRITSVDTNRETSNLLAKYNEAIFNSEANAALLDTGSRYATELNDIIKLDCALGKEFDKTDEQLANVEKNVDAFNLTSLAESRDVATASVPPRIPMQSVSQKNDVPKVVRTIRQLKSVSDKYSEKPKKSRSSRVKSSPESDVKVVTEKIATVKLAPHTVNTTETVSELALSVPQPISTVIPNIRIKQPANQSVSKSPSSRWKMLQDKYLPSRAPRPPPPPPVNKASYHWVSGIAGMIPHNAVKTGTITDNSIDNEYYCSDDEDEESNSIYSYTVRVRCMYDRDTNTLEEYDMNKAYQYGADIHNYFERYYLGTCRAGSVERAIYIVPSDVILGDAMRVVECLPDNNDYAPKTRKLSVDYSFSKTFNTRSSFALGGSDAVRASFALPTVLEGSSRNSMIDTTPSAATYVDNAYTEEEDGYANDNEVAPQYVSIATTRCEYLVEVIDRPKMPIVIPQPEPPPLSFEIPTETPPHAECVESTVIDIDEQRGIVFDDSTVLGEENSHLMQSLQEQEQDATGVETSIGETEMDERGASGETEICEVETPKLVEADLNPYHSPAGTANDAEAAVTCEDTIHAELNDDTSIISEASKHSLFHDHYAGLDSPSLVLSANAYQTRHSEQTAVESKEQLEFTQSLKTVNQYMWEKPVSNWLVAENELFIPQNAVFIVNKLAAAETGRKSSFDRNIARVTNKAAKVASAKLSTEFVFTVRTLLNNVNIVTGSLIYIKEPGFTKRGGLLTRMSAASALSALINLNTYATSDATKHIVEHFESAVAKHEIDSEGKKLSLYGDARFSSKVKTVVESIVPAAPIYPKNSVKDFLSAVSAATTAAAADTHTTKIEQATDIIGALENTYMAVFYFNKRLYHVPLKNVEFMCVVCDEPIVQN